MRHQKAACAFIENLKDGVIEKAATRQGQLFHGLRYVLRAEHSYLEGKLKEVKVMVTATGSKNTKIYLPGFIHTHVMVSVTLSGGLALSAQEIKDELKMGIQ